MVNSSCGWFMRIEDWGFKRFMLNSSCGWTMQLLSPIFSFVGDNMRNSIISNKAVSSENLPDSQIAAKNRKLWESKEKKQRRYLLLLQETIMIWYLWENVHIVWRRRFHNGGQGHRGQSVHFHHIVESSPPHNAYISSEVPKHYGLLK